MLAAAEDLGVDLHIYHYNANPSLFVKRVQEVLTDENTKPDGMLFHNFKKRGDEVLQLAEQHGVSAFVFNAGFGEDAPVGRPREQFSHWIAQMLPDDEYTGWLLSEKLLEEALKLKKRGPDGKVHAVAFGGSRASQASILRIRGFERSVQEQEELFEQNILYAEWSRDRVQKMVPPLIKKYPDISVFWSASDLMAQGILDSAKAQGWLPGKDFVTGGVDWLPESIELIQTNEMAVSVGGHYVEGAWALIVLYDYLNSYDFAETQETTTFDTKMFALTTSNINQFSMLREKLTLEHIARNIDFTMYSKTYHPEMQEYDFDLEDLLKRL
jgi:ABC-type sugar transport system substrate-binding protein